MASEQITPRGGPGGVKRLVTWAGAAVEVSDWAPREAGGGGGGGGLESLVSPLVGQLNKQLGTRPGLQACRDTQARVSGQDPARLSEPRTSKGTVSGFLPPEWTHTHTHTHTCNLTHAHAFTQTCVLHYLVKLHEPSHPHTHTHTSSIYLASA